MTSIVRWRATRAMLALFLCVSASSGAWAQPKSDEDESSTLAKKLSNPISDLVSVPFQFNWEQKVPRGRRHPASPQEVTQ